MNQHSSESLKKSLEEGKKIEADLDVFLKDWEKGRQPAKPRLINRAIDRVASLFFGSPVGFVVILATLTVAFFAFASIAAEVILWCTAYDWHPHAKYTDCLQLEETNAMICVNQDKKSIYPHTPLVRYDFREQNYNCYRGFRDCQREAEAELREVRKLKKTLGK